MKETAKGRACWAWRGITVLFFIVLAAISFRCVFGVDQVFSASDVNIGGLAFRKHMGSDLFFGFYSPGPVLGASNYSISVFNLLVMLLPLHVFSDVFYGAVLVFGSVCMVWFLRIWGRSWTAAVCGALIGFWFNSITLASAGHVYKMEVLALSVLSLCLIESAVRAVLARKQVGYALFAGVAVGLMMVEQQDVALLAGLFVGAYSVFRLFQRCRNNIKGWVRILIPIGAVALVLSAGTLVKSYNMNIANAAQVQGNGENRWEYVTQWSMVPEEWPDLIAPGWSGWSTGNPEGPYWGKIGRSEGWEQTRQGFQNLRLDSIYLGVIPFLLLFPALLWGWKNRTCEESSHILFWLLAAAVGFLLSFGKYSLLYKLFFQIPVINNIRAPIKFLDNVQICLAIIAAFGVDALIQSSALNNKARMRIGIGAAVAGGLMLLAGLRLVISPQEIIHRFTTMGMGRAAELITRNMTGAWIHAAVLTLTVAGVIIFLGKKQKHIRWIGLFFIAALSVDSLLLTSHYFRSESVSGLKSGNRVAAYLKENQGDERIFFLDQNGIYNRWIAVDRSYYGLNLFNIWQMPRMPQEYKNFLGVVGRNQLRLWELSSVKYIAAPASVFKQLQQTSETARMFAPVLNYKIPIAGGSRDDLILEFKDRIPRFALIYGWDMKPLESQCALLADPSHDPHRIALLEPAAGVEPKSGTQQRRQPERVEISRRNAVVKVSTADAAVLRFSQRYQAGWRAFVDGAEAPLLRVDYLCMGVMLPPGDHEVEFKCPRTKQPYVMLAVLAVAILGGTWMTRNRKMDAC